MSRHQEFANHTVNLKDVLDTLDELENVVSNRALNAAVDTTSESVKQLVGVVQGVRKCTAKLTGQYGAIGA